MLYLAGIIIAFFLGLMLLVKKHKTSADYILAAWLTLIGFHLSAWYLFFTGQYTQFPLLTALGFPLPLAQGPFLYVYTKVQTSPKGFRKQQLLHFIPVLLSYIMFCPFYFLSRADQLQVFANEGKPYQLQTGINIIALSISGVVYIALSLVTLIRFRKSIVNEFSNTEKISFNWLLYLIFWLGLIWIVILFVREDPIIFGAAVFFVIWIGYYGIRQVQVFQHHKPLHHALQSDVSGSAIVESIEEISGQKYQKSSLTEEESKTIHERLMRKLDEEQVYKDPELTLSQLAEMLDVHPNHLSQVINTVEQKNFYDLVNEKRIKAFMSLMHTDEQKQYTLLALAFACGFNSKASFNRNFKKFTGLTPSEFSKQAPVA